MKPIILSRNGKAWNLHVNGGSILLSRGIRNKLGFNDVRPIVKRGNALDFGAPMDTPHSFKTKSEAEGVAHSLGRYKFGLGDFVSSYVEVV